MVETKGKGRRSGSLREEDHIASPFEYLTPGDSFQQYHEERESGETARNLVSLLANDYSIRCLPVFQAICAAFPHADSPKPPCRDMSSLLLLAGV